MEDNIRRWVDSYQLPADFYQLAGKPRLDPDREALSRAVSTLWDVLPPYLSDPDPETVDFARRLMAMVGEAERVFSEQQRCAQYDASLIDAMRAEYAATAGQDPAAWRSDDLRDWLRTHKDVHADRVEGLVSQFIPGWQKESQEPDIALAPEVGREGESPAPTDPSQSTGDRGKGAGTTPLRGSGAFKRSPSGKPSHGRPGQTPGRPAAPDASRSAGKPPSRQFAALPPSARPARPPTPPQGPLAAGSAWWITGSAAAVVMLVGLLGVLVVVSSLPESPQEAGPAAAVPADLPEAEEPADAKEPADAQGAQPIPDQAAKEPPSREAERPDAGRDSGQSPSPSPSSAARRKPAPKPATPPAARPAAGSRPLGTRGPASSKDTQMATRRYPVDPILRWKANPEAAKVGAEALIRFVGAMSRGKGTVSLDPPSAPESLVVEQPSDVQEEIADLMEQLQQIAEAKQAPAVPQSGGRFFRSPQEAQISRALQSPASLEFIETPLRDVVDYLKDMHRIEIRFDAQSLRDAGSSEEMPITLTLKGLPLRTALGVLGRKQKLAYCVDRDALVITSSDAASRHLTNGLFEVADLAGRGAAQAGKTEAHALVKAIAQCIEPATWRERGGQGVVVAMPVGTLDVLLVRQSFAVQQSVADVLDRLRQRARPSLGLSRPATGTAGQAAEATLLRGLQSPTSMQFTETPLSDVVEFLKDLHKIEVHIDDRALQARGIALDNPVTFQVNRQPLGQALDQLLQPLRLSHVAQDGVLWITTPAEAQRLFTTEVYRVGAGAATGTAKSEADALLEKIRIAIAPRSWDKLGGPASAVAMVVGSAKLLVVRQMPPVHAQIAKWLAEHASR